MLGFVFLQPGSGMAFGETPVDGEDHRRVVLCFRFPTSLHGFVSWGRFEVRTDEEDIFLEQAHRVEAMLDVASNRVDRGELWVLGRG